MEEIRKEENPEEIQKEDPKEEYTGNSQEEEEKDSEPVPEKGEASEESSEEEGREAENTEPQDEEEKKKGFFGKKKKDKKDIRIEELTDRVQRQMAEFDNFRKRTEKEKSAMFEMGAKSVIEKILPTIDNFERGLAGIPEDKKSDPFVDGMDKVYRQMLSTLEGLGVKPIEAVGKEFDPNLHNAVMHVEEEEAGENIVVEEFQKGYTYHDTVVRHSMVKVAN